MVATNDGTLTPVLALYRPAALRRLREAGEGEALRETVERLNPATVELSEATSVNTPEAARGSRSPPQRLSRSHTSVPANAICPIPIAVPRLAAPAPTRAAKRP